MSGSAVVIGASGGIGAALEAAHKLIVQGGRIIVLSDLAAAPGPLILQASASNLAAAARALIERDLAEATPVVVTAEVLWIISECTTLYDSATAEVASAITQASRPWTGA